MMDWIDTNEIAIALSEKYPEIKPLELRFTDLFRLICELDGFCGEKNHCNEKVLEAVQMAWLDEL
jgi:FeS assembly protein IscX